VASQTSVDWYFDDNIVVVGVVVCADADQNLLKKAVFPGFARFGCPLRQKSLD